VNEAYATKVNQKLAFARLLKAQLLAENPQTLLYEASLEAMCFHLYSAFRLYLGEIAAQYNLSGGSHQSVSDLQAAFAAEGRQSPEANELAQLEASKNSWLRQLQASYRAMLADVGKTTAPSLASDPGFIMVLELDSSALSIVTLDQWQLHFVELVARQRESMLEC